MENQDLPWVTVGIPTYNRSEKLEKAINSILNQSYSKIRIFISDNASTDTTPLVCQKYAEQDQRISFFRHKTNIGMLPNFYYVLDQIQTEYFMWANDDDIWDQDLIEASVKSLESSPDFVGVSGNFIIRIGNENSPTEFIGNHPQPFLTEPSAYKRAKGFLNHLNTNEQGKGIPITGILRTSFMRQISLPEHSSCPDFVMIFQLALLGPFVEVEQKIHKQKTRQIETVKDHKKSTNYNPHIQKRWDLFKRELGSLRIMWNAISKAHTSYLERLSLKLSLARWYMIRIYKKKVLKLIKRILKKLKLSS